MAKAKNTPTITNHKLTDFFNRKSSQPSTSQPTPLSSQTSSSSKGKKAIRSLEDDEALAHLVSVFHTVGRKNVENVYLESDRDLATATSALTRKFPPMSQQTRKTSIDTFEKLRMLSPSLSKEKFDEAFRACAGDMKKVSKTLLSPELRQAVKSLVRTTATGGLGQTSQTLSAPRKSTPNASATRITNSTNVSGHGLRSTTSKSSVQPVRDKVKGRAQPIPITPRPAKKENAPPVDIISISSEHSHITISSDCTPSHISILSSEPPTNDHDNARSYLAPIDEAAQPPRRRSPRPKPAPIVTQERPTPPLKTSPSKADTKLRKKRKLPFESSSEDLIDLTNDDDDVIYAITKPISTQPAVKLEPPSSKPPSPQKKANKRSPRKSTLKCRTKAKVESEDEEVEVIPSSQSDEKELTAPKNLKKDLREVEDCVRAWQASSQTFGLVDDNLSYDASPELDFTIGMDVDSEPMDVDTVMGGDERADVQFFAAPKSPSTVKSSPYTRHPPSTPQRIPPQSSSPTRYGAESTPKSALKARPSPAPIITAFSIAPSPKTASSASSLTRVDDIPPESFGTPSRHIVTPGSTPNKKRIIEGVAPSPIFAAQQATEDAVTTREPTPCALDQKSKTADIIAQIKARAAAATSPSDSGSEKGSRRLTFLDSPSDSDSELDKGELDLFSKIGHAKRAATPDNHASSSYHAGFDSPLSAIDEPEVRLSPPKLRRSGRHRMVSPSPSSARTGTFAFSALHPPPGALPKTLTHSTVAPTTTKKPRKSGGWDFMKLMQEKAAFVAKANDHSGMQNVDLLKYDRDDWDREEGSSGSNGDGSNSAGSIGEDGDRLLDDEDRQQALGVTIDGSVKRVLKEHRARINDGSKNLASVGIEFFELSPVPDASMEVDEPYESSLPYLPVESKGRVANLLRKAISDEDTFAVSSILESRILVHTSGSITDEIFAWAVQATLSLDDTVARSATRLITNICSSHSSHTPSTSSQYILKGLAKLRPNPDFLKSFGFEASDYLGPQISANRKNEVLWRLASIMKALAQAKSLELGEVASLVVLLTAIGLDAKTPLEIQLDISEAIEIICNSYCSDSSDTRGPLERDICAKIHRLANTLDIENKERLILLIPRSSPIVRRICQWVALAILLPDTDSLLVSESEDKLPPLERIVMRIHPYSSKDDKVNPFTIRDKETFDYTTLVHLTEILGRAVDSIQSYVALEKRQEQVENGMSITSPLVLLRDAMSCLGGKIAHKSISPNPSRAKVSLEKLQLRIKYQSEDARIDRSVLGRPRKRNIEAYLTKR